MVDERSPDVSLRLLGPPEIIVGGRPVAVGSPAPPRGPAMRPAEALALALTELRAAQQSVLAAAGP